MRHEDKATGRLVTDCDRAWHAGRSFRHAGETLSSYIVHSANPCMQTTPITRFSTDGHLRRRRTRNADRPRCPVQLRRAADVACNPHLALAAIVHAGVRATQETLVVPKATQGDLSLLISEPLPPRLVRVRPMN